MGTSLKRITFVLTPEMEKPLDEAQRRYYAKNRSEIIRMLLAAGLESMGNQDSDSDPGFRSGSPESRPQR
jgi:metal-responsive CopG/Arc/MetJ family transcriptional regulator